MTSPVEGTHGHDEHVIRVVAESQPAAGSATPSLEVFKLVVEFLRVLAWPLLVLALIVAYRQPVRSVLDSLATKFAEASKVTIGTLSLEIQEKARQVGSAELARQVGTLSPHAVEELLNTPRNGLRILLSTGERDGTPTFGLPADAVLKALEELEAKGMLTFSSRPTLGASSADTLQRFLSYFRSLPLRQTEGAPDRTTYAPAKPLTESQLNYLRNEGYELTESGRKAAEAIVQAVVEQLR